MSDDGDAAGDYAAKLIDALADDIGPRRPCSTAERRAAEFVVAELHSAGLRPRLESFRGPTTFAFSQALAPALALLNPGWSGVLAGLAESDPRLEPVSRLASRRPSQNVVATIEPAGPATRTLVLVSHLDSSRSGLLFHPGVSPHLRKLAHVVSFALLAQALTRNRRSSAWGLRAWRGSRATLVLALALLAERELRGSDVQGANDNASGVAVATTIAGEVARSPLSGTRLVLLATGCEESGTAGMRAFLERHAGAWESWLFVNIDGVGAPATLRYLPWEGVTRMYAADPRLLRLCDDLAGGRPGLALRRAVTAAGLTYDSTPVLARGGRAITLSAQDGAIPNYHTPSDTPQNIDPQVLRRAILVVREVVRAVDRGAAD